MMKQYNISYLKKSITLFVLLFVTTFSFSQDLNLKKYSHTEFFKMIKAEKDSVFKLENALIVYNEATDSLFRYKKVEDQLQFINTDTLYINKAIELKNVHFTHQNEGEGALLHHIVFNKSVTIYNTTSVLFYNCVFNKNIEIDVNIPLNKMVKTLDALYEDYYEAEIGFSNSQFYNNVILNIGTIETFASIDVLVENSKFYTKKDKNAVEIGINNIRTLTITHNQFFGDSFINLFVDTALSTNISHNNFGDVRLDFLKASLSVSELCTVEENIFKKPVILTIDSFDPNHIYRWGQWQENTITNYGFVIYLGVLLKKEAKLEFNDLYQNDSIVNTYKNKFRFENEKAYKYEMRLLGNFYDFYKSQHDSDFANDVYIELKNLETQRFEFLYYSQPSFSNYFTWKINQFLELFSAYGTKPSQAIVVSIYVILLFAFIYLFFPNTWDSMNRNKLMKRITFFTKYFRRKESVKDIYEEERQHDLMSFKEFNTYMNASKKEVPLYFIWLAKPIYYVSSYNYKMMNHFLKHSDILKGKWVDLSPKRRYTTSLIMAVWIFALIVADIMLKFLNALTLSINTFTTLGFGEIPIKGIPRYLAIIQGFIGWFMLTIFSVSLISQLLN